MEISTCTKALNNHYFKEEEIRTSFDDDGNIWFVAKDVAKTLGIEWKRSDTLKAIPVTWKGSREYQTPSGFQHFTIINEPAVYKLAFRSNKPAADEFTDWVASEVLPAIRKTGAYSIHPATETQTAIPEQPEAEKTSQKFTDKAPAVVATNIYWSFREVGLTDSVAALIASDVTRKITDYKKPEELLPMPEKLKIFPQKYMRELTVPEAVFKRLPGFLEYMEYLIAAARIDMGIERLGAGSPGLMYTAGKACGAVLLDACVNG